MLGRIMATDSGHRLEFNRILPASVERVWHLLTDPDERAAWLMAGTLEPRVGGRVELVDDQHHVTGEVTRCEPPHLLAFTWSSTDAPEGEVRFTLDAVSDSSCHLQLVHRLGPAAKVRSVGAGWHALLDALGALAGVDDAGRTSYRDLLAAYEDVPVTADQA